MIVESDASETFEEVEPGDRLYMVRIFDPLERGVISSGMKLLFQEMDSIDQECMRREISFADGIQIAVTNSVLRRMYGEERPEGMYVVGVQEVSVREMREVIRKTEEARGQQESS